MLRQPNITFIHPSSDFIPSIKLISCGCLADSSDPSSLSLGDRICTSGC